MLVSLSPADKQRTPYTVPSKGVRGSLGPRRGRGARDRVGTQRASSDPGVGSRSGPTGGTSVGGAAAASAGGDLAGPTRGDSGARGFVAGAACAAVARCRGGPGG